jgi:hypothetical protein
MGTTKEGVRSKFVSEVVRHHLATKTDTVYKKMRTDDPFCHRGGKINAHRAQNQTRFPLRLAPAFGQ